MLKYNGIITEDLVNAYHGIHTSIFFQGCRHRCEKCFNKEAWDFNGGHYLSVKQMNNFIEKSSRPYITGISILGGEPLHQNWNDLEYFLGKIKDSLPDKKIWMWSGYKLEEIYMLVEMNYKELDINSINHRNFPVLKYVDYLIDGKFIEEKKQDLLLRGSSNQRIIDLKKSLNNNSIVLLEEEQEKQYV